MKLTYVGTYPKQVNLHRIGKKIKTGDSFDLDSSNAEEMQYGFELLKNNPEKFIEAEKGKPGPKPRDKMADVPKNK